LANYFITIPKNYKYYYSNELRGFYEATFTNYRHPGQEKQSKLLARTPQLVRVGHRNSSHFTLPNQKHCEPS